MRNVVLFSVVLAASVSATAHAGDSAAGGNAGPVITLDVQNKTSTGSDGYTDSTAGYSYKYSGGSGKGGDVIFKTRGPVTFVVQLQGDKHYTISTVAFKQDTNSQLSWLNQSSPYSATIQDENSVVQTAEYKVTAKDPETGTTIPCDPMIINR